MTTKQAQLYDYFILSARVLIAWTLMSYGWSKITVGQFGISAEEMGTPVKELSLFRLSWYLFGHEPFNSFVGISQIVAALLLLYNRTTLLGVLLSIPILANILIIDLTYLKMPGFYWRLSYYLLLDALILWHYKGRMIAAFNALVSGMSTRFKFPIWAYLILPLIAILLEIAGAVPQLIFALLADRDKTIKGLKGLYQLVLNYLL